jgi:hypothetical protein
VLFEFSTSAEDLADFGVDILRSLLEITDKWEGLNDRPPVIVCIKVYYEVSYPHLILGRLKIPAPFKTRTIERRNQKIREQLSGLTVHAKQLDLSFIALPELKPVPLSEARMWGDDHLCTRHINELYGNRREVAFKEIADRFDSDRFRH